MKQLKLMNDKLTAAPELLHILESVSFEYLKLGRSFTLNFRDPDYSATGGGYHPVEIRINHLQEIEYITDFCYNGEPPYAELEKCLDFDFGCDRLQSNGMDFPLLSGVEIFWIWQESFISYFEIGVFQVEISRDGADHESA